MKKYDVTLTAHMKRPFPFVRRVQNRQSKDRNYPVRYRPYQLYDDGFVCGEADITEQSEDGLDGAGENTLQENTDCSDCPYFCPVCGECMYEDDCEE